MKLLNNPFNKRANYKFHQSVELGEFYYNPNEFEINEIDGQPALLYIGLETDGDKITIPDGIINCRYMFEECDIITPPDIPDSVTICDYMFNESNIITPPVIPSKVTSTVCMFKGCTHLIEAPAIPKKVTNAKDMFADCKKTVIAQAAFNLKNRNSSKSKIDSLQKMALVHYDGELGSFDYYPEEFTIEHDYSRPDNREVLIYIGEEKKGSNIIIPKGIKRCDYMFEGCDFLTSAPEIPEGVTSCKSMFARCVSLVTPPTKVPEGVTDCEEMFLGCESMEDVPLFPITIVSSKDIFKGCESLDVRDAMSFYTESAKESEESEEDEENSEEIEYESLDFTKYYNEIDKKHAEVLEKCAVLCRSDKKGFTDLTRIEAIRELLKDTDYKEIFIGSASIWYKGKINPNKPHYLVSSHCDTVPSITKCQSILKEDGYYRGTYDNIGTNAAAVISMQEGDLPENVIFSFTSEEETGRCIGAKETVDCLTKMGINDLTCIGLDVTYEGYDDGSLFTVENATKNPEFLHTLAENALNVEPEHSETFRFVKGSKKAIPDNIPEDYVSDDTGWFDEGMFYNKTLKMNAFSLCLPCEGEMHANSGVKVRQPVFEGYIHALESMLYAFTKTHLDLIESKKLDMTALTEKTKELIEVEVRNAKKRAEANKKYSSSGTYTSYSSSYDYDYSSIEEGFGDYYYINEDNYELSESITMAIDESLQYSSGSSLDVLKSKGFREDIMAMVAPDLYEAYHQLKEIVKNHINDYISYEQQFGNTDYDYEEEMGYVDDLDYDYE